MILYEPLIISYNFRVRKKKKTNIFLILFSSNNYNTVGTSQFSAKQWDLTGY